MKQTILSALFVAFAMATTASAQVTYTCTACTEGMNLNGNEGIGNLFDGDVNTKFCGNGGDGVYALVTASEPVYVWGYEMTTANDNEAYERLIKQWVLYGTNDATVGANPDAEGWVTLSDLGSNNFVQMKNFYTQRFFCEKNVKKPFKYFKLVLKDPDLIQLSEFKFLAETDRVATYKWKDSSQDNSKKAVDMLVGTKWEDSNLAGNWVTIESDNGQPYAVKSYSFTTNDDGTWNDRAPKSWTIEGSNDNNSWTVIHQVDNDDAIENASFATYEYTPFNTTDKFRYIKLTLNAMKGTGWTQVGEFHVLATSDESESQYYTNLVNKAKATKDEYKTVLGENDSWYQEYATFFNGLNLDATLETAISSGNYEALETKLAEAENNVIAQAMNPFINGSSYSAIAGSECWGDGHYTQLFDGKETTKWGGNFGSDPQYVIFRVKNALKPSFYKLITGNDTQTNSGRNWKTWSVYGANFTSFSDATFDSNEWTLLDERVDVSEEYLPKKNLYPATFNFNQGFSEDYLYYMVNVFAPLNGSQQQMTEMYLCTEDELSAIRQPMVDALATFAAGLNSLAVEPSLESEKEVFATLYAELKNKNTTNPDRMTEVYNELVDLKEKFENSAVFVAGNFRVISGNTGPGHENHSKLLDGDINTKWCGFIPDGGSYVIFKTYESKKHAAYQLTTGNDTGGSPDRNWKNWKIYGANFASDDAATRDAAGWALIDERENIDQHQLPAANHATASFNFNKTWATGYNYYKIEVSEAYDGTMIQMSEFKLFNDAFNNKDMKDAVIAGLSPNYLYTGSAINVSYTVYDIIGNQLNASDHYTATLTKDGNPVTEVKDMGTYTLTITAKGDYYTGTKSVTFEVNCTVNNGNETNDKIPVYGSHVDNITISQFIIPSTALTALTNTQITHMTFYAQDETVSWGDAKFEVFMTKVDNTTFADATPVNWVTQMNKVKYSGSLSVSNGKMEVTLDDPYRYMGGNLLICFLGSDLGDCSEVNWVGVTAKNAALGGFDSDFTRRNFLPKVSFYGKPTYALTGTNVLFFENYTNDFNYTVSRNIINAVEGQEVIVSLDPDNIEDGKYLTEAFLPEDGITLSDYGYYGDKAFTMPAKAVTVNAELADRTEYKIDLTSATTQVIPRDVYLCLMQQEGYYTSVFDQANNEYLMYIDLDRNGTPDLQLLEENNVYSVKKLNGANSVTVNCRFNIRTFPDINPSPYSSVLVKLNDNYNEESMLVFESFQDDIDNSPMISEWADGKSRNIMIYGRTLWKDNDWNTLCLPFNMTAEQVENQLAPTKLMELDTDGGNTGFDAATGTLSLFFKEATTIEAGKPYIIKWASGNNLVDPVFCGVTIPDEYASAATPTPVTFTGGQFVGTYDYTEYSEENKSILFLGTNNTLYYPQPNFTNPENPVYPSIGAFRAYFKITNTTNLVKSIALNFEDDATGIGETEADSSLSTLHSSLSEWFDLSGRKIVNSKSETLPLGGAGGGLPKGIYIHNGKKVIVK